MLGLRRQGRISPNGSCRLLEAPGGDVALNLPRPEDVELIPALTGKPQALQDPWSAASNMAATTPAPEFVQRARLLGLASAVACERLPATDPYETYPRALAREPDPSGPWTVLDLSALWAGPLATRVLAAAGASVVKVEDPRRPDSARGVPEFYGWVHTPEETTEQVDLTTPSGCSRLASLLDTADVVIESSRPRALEQLGLAPENRPGPPGQVWLGITGHGRTGPARNWTGFGDDAAVAGGLLCRDRDGRPMFCGDAIADPITGLIGALAVLRCMASGGGDLLDVSLSGAAAWLAGGNAEPDRGDRGRASVEEADGSGWVVRVADQTEPVVEAPLSFEWIKTR